MPLGEDVALETLEPADRLAGKPSHLGQLTADWRSLGAHALADGVLHLARERRFEL